MNKFSRDAGEHVRDQYDYHLWAERQVFNHIRSLPDKIVHMEIQSVFPTVSAALVHTYITETIWLKVIAGEKLESIEEYVNRTQLSRQYSENNLEEIEKLFRHLEVQYTQIFNELPDLSKELRIEHPKFGEFNAPVYEVFQHLFNHASYHRGNITAMLRQLGYKGTPTDYILFLLQRSD
ncbi:DinB family protein [Halobacillus salinarum]|uniref:DinB family protein n=1 Tax=Halobacillus salinarum TaxID=2932257 RepID=A0ABY4EFU9_9BACI|nr:DinB family protein [Halobacillus salinarum]UOQ43327.1 DinB family protein [Halobacillus salinarum]